MYAKILTICLGLLILGLPATAQDDALKILTQDFGLGGCNPQMDKNANCCGSPGRLRCGLVLHSEKGISQGCTDPSLNLLRNGNCNLPDPTPLPKVLPAGRPPTGTDLTYLVSSDVHLFRTSFYVPTQIEFVNQLNQFALANSASAVILNGDLTTGAADYELGAFRLLWEEGWLRNQSITRPVFFGLGNHDTSSSANFFGADTEKNAKLMRNYLMARTANFQADWNGSGCLIGVDLGCTNQGGFGGSGNYSWDWHGVHMVQLNTWAGETYLEYSPPFGINGLEWLRRNLAHYVGTSGRPVILNQHFDLANIGNASLGAARIPTWEEADWEKFRQVIEPYNIIGIFTGHTHVLGYESRSLGPGRVLDGFRSGSGGGCGIDGCTGGEGKFFKVAVTDKYLEVSAYGWTAGGAIVPADRPLSGLRPVCRKRINSQARDITSQVSVAVNTIAKTVTIRNVSGAPIPGEIAVRLSNLGSWDFVDDCQNPLRYLKVSQDGMAAGATSVLTYVPVTGQAGTPPPPELSAVVSYADDLIATPSPVIVPPEATDVQLTATGTPVGFTFAASRPWIKVSADSSVTPAKLTIGRTESATYEDGSVAITPLDSRYSDLKIPVSIAKTPVQFQSPSVGATILLQNSVAPLPSQTVAPPGGQLEVDVPDNSPSPGTLYRFKAWTDGGPKNRRIDVGLNPLDLRVLFDSFYQVQFNVQPAAAGSALVQSPAAAPGGFYSPGTYTLVAQPASGYTFAGFIGTGVSGNTLQLGSAPVTIQANFTPAVVTPPQIIVTQTLTRNPQNAIVANLVLTNRGGTTAQATSVTVSKIGAQGATIGLPTAPIDIAPGASANVQVVFPGTAGNPGSASVLTAGGTYTGSSFNFSARVTLP